jgi:hypothetical protein
MTWIFVLLFLVFIGLIARSVWRAPGRRRRRLAIGLATLALAYLGCIALLMSLERFLIFHPQTAAAWLAPEPLRVEDAWFTLANGSRIHAWWCPTEGAERVVLYSHGNAGNLSFRRDAIRAWQQHARVSVLIYDYPGFGQSEGRPYEVGCYAAGKAAYDWLRQEKQVDPQRIVLYGKSLGGAIAVHLATTEKCEALVLYSAFTSIPDLGQGMFPVFPIRWMVRTQFDNASKLAQYRGKLVVGHGLADSLVPCAHGRQLFASCPAAAERKKLLLYEGVGHGGPPVEFYRSVAEFLSDRAVE